MLYPFNYQGITAERLTFYQKRYNGKPFLGYLQIFMQFISADSFLGLFADVGQDTAIDVEHMAIDGIGGVRSQEHGGSSQFLRL